MSDNNKRSNDPLYKALLHAFSQFDLLAHIIQNHGAKITRGDFVLTFTCNHGMETEYTVMRAGNIVYKGNDYLEAMGRFCEVQPEYLMAERIADSLRETERKREEQARKRTPRGRQGGGNPSNN